MEINIKKMNISDLDLIKDVLQTDFDDFWNYNVFKQELENSNSKYIVAMNNDEIVGFAGIWIAIDVAHVTNIVVKKDMRKSGIGSILLKELIKLSKDLNMNEITLEVNESNNAAISLYKKFSFEQVGLRKNYYKDGSNALIMTNKTVLNGSPSF